MNKPLSRLIDRLKTVSKKTLILLSVAFVVGFIVAFILRFSLVSEHKTHYHANFALYINDARDEFKNFTFYEEIAACSSDQKNDPRVRVHMHNSINNVAHIHDNAVTWSDFFANLGYTLGDKVIATGSGVFVDGQDGKSLRFYLNGKYVTSIADESIKSEDTLLIDYGSDDSQKLIDRYNSIHKDAHEYNERTDPAACSGGKSETFSHRFKRTLGIDSNN